MTNEELKGRIGSNIARLRRAGHMTQAELAEKLNYSDKAVSKWERAESIPDVLTLVQIAQLFGTDVNDLLSDPSGADPIPDPIISQPAAGEKEQPRQALDPKPARKADKGVIQKLCTLLVWVVALFVYILLDSFGVSHAWLSFVVAVLANAIVLVSLRGAWKMRGLNRVLISVIMWDTLLFCYLLIWLNWQVNVWRVLLLGIPGQAAILLWEKLFHTDTEPDKEGNDG